MCVFFQIYHDGTVDFNGGSMSIAVFGANLTGDVTAHFVYQHRSAIDEVHFETQKEYVADVLAASVDDNNVTDMFVITWTHYTYNGINVRKLIINIFILVHCYIILAVDRLSACNNINHLQCYLCTAFVPWERNTH